MHATKNCPAAGGVLSGTSLGLLKLGDTLKQVKTAIKGSKESRTAGHPQFCVSPGEMEVGFANNTLRQLLHGGLAPNHALWILTGNPRYTDSNVGIGMPLKAAQKLLNPGVVEQSKNVSIYLVRQPSSTIVLVANHNGVVQKIGIADNRITANAKLMLALAGAVTGSVAVTAPQ
jgi:hypothetical protein